jgi:hypothetical protein
MNMTGLGVSWVQLRAFEMVPNPQTRRRIGCQSRACQPKRPNGAARGKYKGIDGTGFLVDEGVTGGKKTAGVHMDPDIHQRQR